LPAHEWCFFYNSDIFHLFYQQKRLDKNGLSFNFHNRLALIAEGFLKRNWLVAEGGTDKGPKFNQGVESILKVVIYFQAASSETTSLIF